MTLLMWLCPDCGDMRGVDGLWWTLPRTTVPCEDCGRPGPSVRVPVRGGVHAGVRTVKRWLRVARQARFV